MFKDMSDWCMAKDYNGAERFNDGSCPLMVETEFADIIIGGIPNENGILIGVYPHGEICHYYYEGEIATKELAEQIGADIFNYIHSNTDGQFMFINGDFNDFFNTLQVINIRTHDTEKTDDSFEYIESDEEMDQGEEL